MMEAAEPIQAMWQFYLKYEHTMSLTWEGIEELLEGMLLEWRMPEAG